MVRIKLLGFSLFAMLAVGGCSCDGSTGGNGNGDGGVNGSMDMGTNGSTNDGGSGNGSPDAGDGGGGTNGTVDTGVDLGTPVVDTGVDLGPPICDPLTPAQACPGKCGIVSNGCSDVIDCSASGNQGVVCGANQQCLNSTCVDTVVDAGVCTPTTCAALGHTCGQAPNGCGGVLDCWPQGSTGCGVGQACIPTSPGGPLGCVMGSQGCAGSLCNSLPTGCSAQNPTRLTGTVVTPGIDPEGDGTFINRFPVPNAVVYIPADPATALPTIYEGVDPNDAASCGRCADEQFVVGNQSVLAAGITDYRGQFTLAGRIPVGAAFNLVIKVGKWRRVVSVPANVSSPCQTVTLATQYTRLNATRNDGAAGTWLPHIAIGTGEVDEMECVLRNAGIADSEFTLPSGNGRIHMYRMDGAQMGTCVGNTTWGSAPHACSDSRLATDYGPSILIPNYGCVNQRIGCSWAPASTAASNLHGNLTTMQNYDAIIWDCEGDEVQYDADEPEMEQYVNAGGRMFASHYAYTWIENNGTLDQSAQWGVTGAQDTDTAYISMPTGNTTRARANPVKSVQFRDWLDYLGGLTGTTAGLPLENPATPSFTVADPRDRAGSTAGPSTDEWIYINNNGAKIQQLSFNTPYGAAADMACGRVAYTGFHVSLTDNNDTSDVFPNVCLNDGTLGFTTQEAALLYMLFDLNACVSDGDPVNPPQCTPLDSGDLCPNENDACGFLADTCGGVVDCGGCLQGSYCAGNVCRPIPTCTPATCASLGYACGVHPDGCGGIADNAMGNDMGCGVCPGGQSCNAMGQCVTGGCVPDPDACSTQTCDFDSDGCGNVLPCGDCNSTEICVSGSCYSIE